MAYGESDDVAYFGRSYHSIWFINLVGRLAVEAFFCICWLIDAKRVREVRLLYPIVSADSLTAFSYTVREEKDGKMACAR
jgi:hypothetical protein